MNEDVIVFTRDDGTRVICDLLFAFDREETGNHYVVFTDNSFDEEGKINVFAAIENPLEDPPYLPIETTEEWDLIESILNDLSEISEKVKFPDPDEDE